MIIQVISKEVVIYYKESLAICVVNITSLTECLVCEVTIQNRKRHVAVLYRSLSQSTYQGESFFLVWRIFLVIYFVLNPSSSSFLGSLNARLPERWCQDIVTLHGTQIESLTTKHGFKQLISALAHTLPQSVSCIILLDQPSYVNVCGAHPSLHPNCHYQITFCKLSLKVEYQYPYQLLVWNFKKSNNNAIKKSIELVN